MKGELRKMYKYETEHRPANNEAMADIAANFKSEYFVAYYEHHGILPKTFQET